MSLRIKNIQAASIYEKQYGFRSRLDTTDAMLVDSLFLDYLLDNDLLDIWNGKSTRDIICVEFGYGTKSYDFLRQRTDNILAEDPGNKEMQLISDNLEKNKEFCKEISRDNLRIKFYEEGLTIKYKRKTIKYRMLYRTPGKAKKGTVMFINQKLYKQVHDFLYMGIKLQKKNAPIVEIGAYSSLITSSIIDKIKIMPNEILVVKDVDSHFTTKAKVVDINKNKECMIHAEDKYDVVNTLFDGQALIDTSIFPKDCDGYVLLRHHMTKMAAFHSNIQMFMKDYFGKDYSTAHVKDMWGRDVKVSDIKLITTENALKWMKFNVDFDYWSEWIAKNDYYFGIVKTAHPSKLGDVQRMSYQMINSLNIDTMQEVMAETIAYIDKLKNDDEVFLKYLRDNQNFYNDYEPLLALVEHNSDFINSEYFRSRKHKIIEKYVLDIKSGHSIQNADNLTIVGSPYAMLLHAVGADPFSDPTFKQEDDCIQCYTNRFDDGEYLAEFRSPFNSRSNLGYLHNNLHPLINKYFNFGKLIIAVNMIETDFQDRNNGSDMDSDSVYTTNQPDIVSHAKYCYSHYPTVVNNIPKEKNIYSNSMTDYAIADNTLAAAQLAIGESSNLAQLALTYTYNFDSEKYCEYADILAVLAQVAIDQAKRKFEVDITSEIRRIRADLDIDTNGLPKFWLLTKKNKQKFKNAKKKIEKDKESKLKIKSKINKELVCPMNELYDYRPAPAKRRCRPIPMEEFWIKHELKEDRRKSRKVEQLIENYGLELNKFLSSDNIEKEDIMLFEEDLEYLIDEIKTIYISKNYIGLMSWLLNRAFVIGSGAKGKTDIMASATERNKPLLIKVLYTINKDAFLSCFLQKTCTTST